MDEMNQNMGQDSYFEPNVSKKNGNLPLIIAIIAIVAAVGVMCAYFLFFNSPKDVYLNLEKKNAKAFVESMEEFFDSKLGRLLVPDETKPVVAGVEFTTDIKMEEQNEVIDLLNDSKLAVTQYYDLENDYNHINMEINLDNKDFLEADVLLTDNKLGLTVKDILDKYFVVDTQNLLPVYEKLGVPSEGMPNRILTNKELQEKVALTNKEEKTLEKALGKYPKILSDNLEAENVKIIKNEEISINGENVKCNKVEVTITPEYTKETLIELFSTLKNDDELLDILFNKYEALVELYEDAGYTMEEMDLTRESFVNDLDELLAELEELAYDEDDGNLIMKVYYNNKKEIIQRRFVNTNYVDDVIIFTTYSGEDSNYYALEFDGEEISDTVTFEDNKEMHDILIVDTKIQVVLDKVSDNKTEIEITAEELAGFVIKATLAEDGNKVSLDTALEFAVLDQYMKFYFDMYVAENEKFDRKTLDSNVVDIASISDTELQKEAETIMANAQKWVEKHADVINALVGSYNPYMMY